MWPFKTNLVCDVGDSCNRPTAQEPEQRNARPMQELATLVVVPRVLVRRFNYMLAKLVGKHLVDVAAGVVNVAVKVTERLSPLLQRSQEHQQNSARARMLDVKRLQISIAMSAGRITILASLRWLAARKPSVPHLDTSRVVE